MRRVRPDPIPYPVQARILDAAIRAPSGGNTQGWRFILVDDPAVKDQLGPLYRDSIRQLWATAYAERGERARSAPEDPVNAATLRMVASAQQLAARAEGVGSALTSVLGVFHGAEAMEILGVPDGHGWVMACCVSFGYPTGRWGVAKRHPVQDIAYRNSWGAELGLDVPGPLWPGERGGAG